MNASPLERILDFKNRNRLKSTIRLEPPIVAIHALNDERDPKTEGKESSVGF